MLELSLREALQLGHNYIGTEHILLGLIREGDGVAAQLDVVAEVDENLVAETLSIMFGPTSRDEDTDMRQQPDTPQTLPFAPTAMTNDDREIWGMA